MPNSVTGLPNVAALLANATPWPWYATVNDLIGGTMVANVDLPAHAIDTRNRPENTHRVVADMVCRDEDSALIASAPALAAALIEAADALRQIVAATDIYPADNLVIGNPRRIARAALARLVAFDASLSGDET